LKLDLLFYFGNLLDFEDLADFVSGSRAGLLIFRLGFEIRIQHFRNVFEQGLGLCVRLILFSYKNYFSAQFPDLLKISLFISFFNWST